MRKYDGLFESQSKLLDHFDRLLADHDQQTSAALASNPEDFERILNRAQFLRGQGREAEALAILLPWTKDVSATHAAGENGMWIINEAAYALLALGRHDEALGAMSHLVKMDMASSPGLIGPAINYAEMLRRAGRADEAFAHAEQLKEEQGFANAYGEMWIMAAAA